MARVIRRAARTAELVAATFGVVVAGALISLWVRLTWKEHR